MIKDVVGGRFARAGKAKYPEICDERHTDSTLIVAGGKIYLNLAAHEDAALIARFIIVTDPSDRRQTRGRHCSG